MSLLPRHLSRWDGMTLSVVVLMILAFALMPFGRSVNAPLGVLSLISIWLLATQWRWFWQQPATRWMLVLILALWVPQLLALPGAANFDRAWGGAAYYPLYGLAALPVVWAAWRHDITPMLLYAVLGISLLWAIDGLIQFTFGTSLLGFPYNGRRLTGMFHPNLTMGVVMAHLLPLVMEAIRRLMQRHWAWVLAVLPILATIVLTGSRSAMLVMGLAVLAYGVLVIWHHRPRWQWVVTALLLMVLAITAVLALSPQTRDRVLVTSQIFEMDRESFNAATAQRGDAWIAGLKVAQDDPWLGVGVRGFEKVAVERGYSEKAYSHLHFFALDVQVSTGMVGLLAYLLAYIGLLVALWKGGVGRMATGVAVIAAGLALWPLNTHFGFYASYTLAVLWPIVGLAAALVTGGRGAVRQTDAPPFRHSRESGNPR